MQTFREIKRRARTQLHERMAEPALYLASPTATPVSVTVRLHLSFAAVGELLRGGFAERQEYTPRIVFLNSQVQPKHKGIVITKDMGAWDIDNAMPEDDITTDVEVTKMTNSEVTGFGWDPSADYLGFPPPEFPA